MLTINLQKQALVNLNKMVKTVDKKALKTNPLPESLIPRGKPKSGRVWKSEKQKFSSIIKTKGIRQSLEKKNKLRKDLARVLQISRGLKEAVKVSKEEKKERRRENMKRKEENQKKSEIIQVITNSKKLKKMKRNQLRNVEKRDTTVVVKA